MAKAKRKAPRRRDLTIRLTATERRALDRVAAPYPTATWARQRLREAVAELAAATQAALLR